MVGPCVWMGLTIESEVCFDCLVGTFGSSVSLGVVCGTFLVIDTKESVQFLEDGGGKLRSTVCDESFREAEAAIDMIVIELSGGESVNCFVSRNQYYGSGAIVVFANHKCVVFF